jgi:hypothetical protein
VNSTVALYFILLTIVVVLNLVATVRLTPSDVYSTSQKILQLVLIWMLPFVGAILVLTVLAHDRKSASPEHVRNDEGPWLPGIGPMSDSSRPTSSFGDVGTPDGHGGGGHGD